MLSWRTGISAFGYMWTNIDQVPWSSPQLSLSSWTLKFLSFDAICAANYGFPGAGYYISNNCFGNPPKSWIVFGFCIAVTNIPFVYQCADMQTIAFGFGSIYPNFFHV